MKKIFAIISLLMISAFAVNDVCAQTTLSSKQSKEIEKDVKNRAKELKKAGWEPLASLSTMETSMNKYLKYLAEDPDNRIPLTGIAIGKSNKIGRENAVHTGITNYASRAAQQVVGKLKSVMSAENGTGVSEEIDKFGAAYEAGVNSRLNSLVKEHFVLVRTTKDGNKEFNAFMSIDETAARKAREEAARAAAEKSNLNNLSQMVDEFIGEPVEPMD